MGPPEIFREKETSETNNVNIMDIDDLLDLKSWDHRCIVCGKNVEHGGGMAHIKQGDVMVALCCPLCMKTFEKDPGHYAAKARAQRILRGNPPGTT